MTTKKENQNQGLLGNTGTGNPTDPPSTSNLAKMPWTPQFDTYAQDLTERIVSTLEENGWLTEGDKDTTAHLTHLLYGQVRHRLINTPRYRDEAQPSTPEPCDCSVHLHCPRCHGIQVEATGHGVDFYCLECGYERRNPAPPEQP